jgi:hypothetical protein
VFEDEGTAAGWTGLHQHNITIDDEGRMLCRARNGDLRIIADPRVAPYSLPPLGIIPKVDGRRWLSFGYRRVR